MINRVFVFAVVVALSATAASAGMVWDAAADFSIASNPNGAWSYGYGVGAVWGGAFDMPLGDASVGGWTRSQGGNPDYSPYLFANTTDTPGSNHTAHSLNLSSGTGGDDYHCLVRWTAPADGWYQVDSMYTMMGYPDGTFWSGEMDVTTAVNGVAVFFDKVSGFDYSGTYGNPAWPTYEPGPKTATGTYFLTAGSTVDFVAGIGWVDANSDFTNIAGCKITAVPEPATLVTLLTAAGGLALALFFRRRS